MKRQNAVKPLGIKGDVPISVGFFLSNETEKCETNRVFLISIGICTDGGSEHSHRVMALPPGLGAGGLGLIGN
jgi:hypothetical protein